jgi:hypothetical protein
MKVSFNMIIKNYLLLILLSIAGTAFYGCDEVTTPLDPVDTTHIVINFDNAALINLGAPVMDYISAPGNYHVYKFATKRGGVATITVDSVPGNLDMNVDFYDAQKNWLYGNYGAMGQTVYLYAVKPPNAYYVVVKDGNADGSSEQPYRITVNLDSSDYYEYNNTLPSARTIGINVPLQAKIKPEDDDDAFQFYSPKGGIVQFWLSNVPQNIDMVSDVYDYQNNYIGGITGVFGQSYNFGIMLFPGTYYIKLHDGGKDAFSNNYYNLKVTLDTTDYWEINNSFPYAKTIAVYQDVSGKINPVGDVDMFKSDILTAGQLQVIVSTVPADITMVVELYDVNQTKVANAIGTYNGAPVTLNYVVSNPGVYYVSLYDEYNDNVSDEYFHFKIVK